MTQEIIIAFWGTDPGSLDNLINDALGVLQIEYPFYGDQAQSLTSRFSGATAGLGFYGTWDYFFWMN